jgi:hypothetical protein
MFPINQYDANNPTYKKPLLVNRTTGIEVDLSFDSAKQWLKTLEPYFHDREELSYVSKHEETKILNKMLDLCNEAV